MYTHLQRDASRPPVTLATLARMKAEGEKIASLTCYDASFAVLLDAADVDVVLVGDSLGMVIQGHNTTVPVTMDHMVYHSAAVARGLHRPFLIADLPFMSYPSQTQALEHSVRLMQQGGAQMVKLESGGKQTEIVEFLASHDIAVCAHLGLKPQSVHKTGGFRVQGRERETAARLLEEARGLEAAGAGHRHRRRPRYRRSDPRHLRHAGHYHRAQAALRAQFHGRRAQQSRGAATLRTRREAGRVPRARALLLEQWRPSPRLPPCASACAAATASASWPVFS